MTPGPASQPLRGAYLGPEGTFTEIAARRVRTFDNAVLTAGSDAHTIAQGVEDATLDFGVVPIENSVHGTVLPTLDELVFERKALLIREEIVVDVAFTLYANPNSRGTTPPTIVLSHPHALAQCRDIIAQKGLTAVEVSSTAEACRLVATTRPDALCIGGPTAGETYDLTVVEDGVQDRDGGSTRFYVLARSLAPHHVDTEQYRTALVLTPARDRPGVLLDLLRPFAERGLNLSSLMSRPLRSGLGLYCFIAVVDAHIDAPSFGPALSELLDNGVRIKNLGSYLAWPTEVPEAGAHAEFPAGSVAAVDPPEQHARVLAPPQDT